jgi:hypothetical protein
MRLGLRLTAATFALGLQVSAQTSGTITGYVIDAKTKKPLQFAHAVVKDTRYGGIIDSIGYFEIKGLPVGTYALEFRHVGYKTKYRVVNVHVGETVELKIELEQEAIMLPEITVTDTAQIERLVHQYPGSTVITRQMLLNIETHSTAEAVRILAPRFDVSTERSSARRTPRNPRAISTEIRNIVLFIDGRRIHPSGDDVLTDPNWLDKYVSIEEIELMVIHRGDNAWIRAGRRGERLDWLIEIQRKKP